MTLLLLLATLAVFLTVQWYLHRQSERSAELARARAPLPFHHGASATPPPDLLFHPGHTWVRIHDDKLASIGATVFASNFAGTLSAIELPREGARLHQAEPGWTLVSAKRRRLSQVMPIDGKVLAVNHELLEDPELAQQSPYEKGWILRVRPRDLCTSVRNLLPGTAAPMWIDAARAHIVSRLSPALGAVALDGGEWVARFGDQLNEADWQAMRRELFPTTLRDLKRPSHEPNGYAPTDA